MGAIISWVTGVSPSVTTGAPVFPLPDEVYCIGGIPNHIITPQMTVDVQIVNSNGVDQLINISWLVDDEPVLSIG